MLRRVVAAVAAVGLAIVGIVAVISYANRADQRALESLDTVDVLVVQEPIREGAVANDLGDLVESEPVPLAYVVDGAVDDLTEIEGQILTADLQRGEQLQRGRFASKQELRPRGGTPLPEEAADLHQVTIPLNNPRALGGNISPGDRVGVFMSFDIEGDSGYVMSLDGAVERMLAEEEEGEAAGSGSISTTHLTLHKVLVARVEGGLVAPPPGGEEEDEAEEAQDTINVTLALDAPDAERLVFAAEFGLVWLSLEPEDATEDSTGVVTVAVPNEGRNVYQ